MTKNKRNKDILELRAKGLTLPAISNWVENKYGEKLSRQRIHQIANGYSTPSSKKWIKTLWESIKKRDGYCCQWGKLCDGKPKKTKELVIHHLDFDDRNNDLSNLITLCNKCHASFHSLNHINPKIKENLDHSGERIERVSINCKWCDGRKILPSYAEHLTGDFCSMKCKIKCANDKCFQYYMLAREGDKTLKELAEEFGTYGSIISRYISRAKKIYDLPSINLVENNLNNIREEGQKVRSKKANDRKNLAEKLSRKGYKVRFIAEIMRLNVNTIYRYLKNA